MEYELNAHNTLIFKKILILFRHISLDLQIIASENGLNLYAFNPSNSVWLHIQLGRAFFDKIQVKQPSDPTQEAVPVIRHWYVSTKHLCQSLSIVIPPGQKSSPFGAVLIKDLNNNDNLKNSFGLDKLIIKEYQDDLDFLSLIFICSNRNIEYKLTIPNDLAWSNWHYLRISPTVFYKSITPFSSQYNDLSITYNDSKEDLLLNVINNTSKLSGNKNKKKVVSGKVLINSRHIHKLDLDNDLTYPTNITISIKEFLSLVSFCESIKCPLSLVLRKPGDPVIALFGGSVDACETVTTTLNIHSVVNNGCKDQGDESPDKPIASDNLCLSGSLWISSFKGEDLGKTLDGDDLDGPEPSDIDIFETLGDPSQQVVEYTSRFTDHELDLMYKVLLEDFKSDNIEVIVSQKTQHSSHQDPSGSGTVLSEKEVEELSTLLTM